MAATITGPGAPERGREPGRRTDGHGPEVSPTREDPVVRGLSEVVGGPLGQHAAVQRPPYRLLTPARIVILAALAVFAVHWIQKSPCQDGWAGDDQLKQYANYCYTDVLALYGMEGLNTSTPVPCPTSTTPWSTRC
jgi:hypothetical protein